MQTNFEEVNTIAQTLPIGYYAKRRVPVCVDKDSPVSFYDVDKDTIHFSYPQVKEGIENAVDGEDYTKDTAIRSMLYHELSHALLTPRLCGHVFKTKEEGMIFNIFEDERIETLLNDYYLNTNFKKSVLYTNGGKIIEPQNEYEAFFNLVRFRMYGDTEFAKRVDEIIEKYAHINGNSCTRGYCEHLACAYIREILSLFNDFKTAYQNNDDNLSFSQDEANEIEQEIGGVSNSSGQDEQDIEERENGQDGNGQGGQDGQDGQDGNGQDGQDGNGQDGQDGQDGNGQDGQDGNGQDHRNHCPNRKLVGGRGQGRVKPFNAEEILSNCGFNTLHDHKLTYSLETIISNFNKRNNSGSGCTGYSGIFNPRNTRNEDYRFFDRRLNASGNNKYGSLHLNLFIDNSGSFDNNKDAANTLINSLEEIERRNHNFTFDVILCGDGLTDTKKENRHILANEGTSAEYEEVRDFMKSHLKKNAFVYNIVMYDGGCWTGNRNAFLAWDRNNVTIIDTGANNSKLKDLKCARIRIVGYNKLVTTLGDEVVQTLQIAFR